MPAAGSESARVSPRERVVFHARVLLGRLGELGKRVPLQTDIATAARDLSSSLRAARDEAGLEKTAVDLVERQGERMRMLEARNRELEGLLADACGRVGGLAHDRNAAEARERDAFTRGARSVADEFKAREKVVEQEAFARGRRLSVDELRRELRQEVEAELAAKRAGASKGGAA